VIARSQSWSERTPDRLVVAAAAAGVALFLGCFALLHAGPLSSFQIVDTPVYQDYGDAIVDGGDVPYRDFSLEYPPGALPVFILPSLAPADDYRTVFELLMAACGAAMVALVVVTLAAVGATRTCLFAAAAFAGLAPLALGPVVLTRFDLWPAMLTAGVLAALVTGRSRLGFALLGLAAAVKVYPLVLLPIALVYVVRRHGAREAAVSLLVMVGVLAVVLVPFAILAPDGLVDSFERQTGRPLQIETLGASLLLAAHQLRWYLPTVVNSFGSQNLEGALPDTLATVETALQIVAVVGIWVLFATTRARAEQLLAGAAAAVAAFVALGKVLSPQFLMWLVPLVPLVAGGYGVAASGLLLAALVLTHLWFPSRYWDLVALDGVPAWLLVIRNAALLALLVVLVVAIRRVRGPCRSA
jgi:uncharacterized membrane protein